MDLLGDLQLGTSTTPALTPSNNNNSVNLPNNNAPVTNSGSNLDSLLSLGNIMQPTNSSNMTSLLNITQPSTNNISNPITPMVSSSNIMTPISATPITSIPATPFTPLSAASAIQKGKFNKI